MLAPADQQEALHALTGDLLRMGGLAEVMIANSARAFSRSDQILAREVIETDLEIDELHDRLEQQIMLLLDDHRLKTAELQVVVGTLKISNDLERIGDLAKNIAKRSLAIGDSYSLVGQNAVDRMSRAVAIQLKRVLDAHSTMVAEEARQVWLSDEDIDEHYNSMFREVLTYMMEDPRKISVGAHMIFIAKNLERIGDHCTNIAEVVHLLITGEALPSARPKRSELLGE